MDRGRLVDVGDSRTSLTRRPAVNARPISSTALDFVSALHRVAARDPEVHEILVAVRYLARPDNALHEPALVERVRAEMRAGAPTTMAA